MKIVSVAAECEPWAKAGGLGDVVDALARSLGRSAALDGPVDVFLPAYRSVVLPPDSVVEERQVLVPGPYGPATKAQPEGGAVVTVRSVLTHGYRLRLVDFPAAFDRDGIYGHPDDVWRFGLLARAVLETLRAEARPVDLLHVHDWHAATSLVLRDRFYADDPIVGRGRLASILTIHNLAYHGWVDRAELATLAWRLAIRSSTGARSGSTCCGRGSSERTWSTRSARPSRPRRSRPSSASASTRPCAGRRPSPILPDGRVSSGSSTGSIRRSGTRRSPVTWRPASRAPTWPARRPAGPTFWSGLASTRR
jgi:glycogen synthase